MYHIKCVYSVNSNKAPLVENLFKLFRNTFHLLLGHFDAMKMKHDEKTQSPIEMRLNVSYAYRVRVIEENPVEYVRK